MSEQISTPLTLQQYQDRAIRADRKPSDLAFPLLGLFGETGSLLSEVKKKQRDKISYAGYTKTVVEELGDVLWYLTAVATRDNLSIADMVHSMARDSENTDHKRAADITFMSLQQHELVLQAEPTPAFEKTLLKLASDVGLLMTDFTAGNLANNSIALSGRLSAIMRTLIQAATEAGVTLEQAAEQNLKKVFDRWPLPEGRLYPELFDKDSLSEEQLPRRLTFEVFERNAGGKIYVLQRCNGIFVGGRLTDNIMEPDDYRFHDVFHHAYAAVLGWSPVTRALLKLKRKNQPKIDETQDGARAILIEEGITTWIFNQAKELELFKNLKRGELSFGLLKTVQQFVRGYEPEKCPLWLWEEAILQGYEAFRFLKEKRQARVTIDLNSRSLSIAELSV